MTDILFGQSYYPRFDPKLIQMGQPYPPLGTLYAAGSLKEKGYTVSLFDATLAASESEWDEALNRERPSFAVIYDDQFNYFSKMCLLRMREAAFRMIGMARERGCQVIFFGSDATDHLRAYREAGADHIIVGEGEATLIELLDRLTGRTSVSLEEIPGLAYPVPGRSDLQVIPRPLIRNLDRLPFPAWDLVDIPSYRSLWRSRHGYHSMNMVTTRGCPYSCNWCAKPIYGQRYTVRSPENVVEEMGWLKRKFRPDHIWFGDDIFGLKPGWIRRFADLVREQDAVLPFKCQMRADLIHDDTALALREGGCRTVWMGAESGSQMILAGMDKDLRVEQIHEATRLLRSEGIEVCFFLQFGYPGEGWEEIRETMRMVRECKPDDIGISVSYPLPGTKFYERVAVDLGKKQNWVNTGDLAMLYRGPYSAEFYRQLHRTIHRSFRIRKSWMKLRGSGLLGGLRRMGGMVLNTILLPFSWTRLVLLRTGKAGRVRKDIDD